MEQREHFQLLFVASPCDLPSLRYNLLEITLSFQNTPVPILVSRLLHKGHLSDTCDANLVRQCLTNAGSFTFRKLTDTQMLPTPPPPQGMIRGVIIKLPHMHDVIGKWSIISNLQSTRVNLQSTIDNVQSTKHAFLYVSRQCLNQPLQFESQD